MPHRLNDTTLLINWLYQFNARAWQDKNIKQLKIISQLIRKIASAAMASA